MSELAGHLLKGLVAVQAASSNMIPFLSRHCANQLLRHQVGQFAHLLLLLLVLLEDLALDLIELVEGYACFRKDVQDRWVPIDEALDELNFLDAGNLDLHEELADEKSVLITPHEVDLLLSIVISALNHVIFLSKSWVECVL